MKTQRKESKKNRSRIEVEEKSGVKENRNKEWEQKHKAHKSRARHVFFQQKCGQNENRKKDGILEKNFKQWSRKVEKFERN